MSTYRTRETSLATFLIAMGNHDFKIEPITQDAYWFIFETKSTKDLDEFYKLEGLFLGIKSRLIKEIQDDQRSQLKR